MNVANDEEHIVTLFAFDQIMPSFLLRLLRVRLLAGEREEPYKYFLMVACLYLLVSRWRK